MIQLGDLFPLTLLDEMGREGYVRRQTHPDLPLGILNYSEKAAYDGRWNQVTRQCRGLIYNVISHEVVARPFPKFFNHAEPDAPELDLEAFAVVTDKLDGSLGILYPTRDGHAVATRGSFTSEQALHATEVYRRHVATTTWLPFPGLTYLFEIIYPENRIVVDYGDTDDLVLLAILDTDTGQPFVARPASPFREVETHPYATLAEALLAEPRPNAEGLVVYLPDANARVKLKQADYVALHRILTGTNARDVWEYAAVRACKHLIREPKHWPTYLGMDPARAEQLLAASDDWFALSGVPDEFYGWIRATIAECEATVDRLMDEAHALVPELLGIEDRRARFERVATHPLQKEIMRLASREDPGWPPPDGWSMAFIRAWRCATPAPTAPFAREESIA